MVLCLAGCCRKCAHPVVYTTNAELSLAISVGKCRGTVVIRNRVFPFAAMCFVLLLLVSIAHAQNQCQVGYQFFCGDRSIPGTLRCDTEGPCLAVCYIRTCPGPPGCPTCNRAGKPIDLLTGDTYITETDIRLPGLGGGLTLARTWNSIPFTSRASLGMFGLHWTSTFEEGVFVDTDGYVKYLRGDGSTWSFLYSGSSGGNYLFSAGGPANEGGQQQLSTGATTGSSTNWTLTFQNGETRTFDGTTGKMLSIVDRNGNTTQFTYDASYRLVTVTDPGARHLYFHYSGSSPYIVTSVTSDFGVSLTYSYDTQGRLSQVTEPDSSTLSFQFDSESHITAVLDGNGKVLESHTYNGCGQGLTSARAGGAEGVTVSYSQSCDQPMPRLAFDPLRGQYPKF